MTLVVAKRITDALRLEVDIGSSRIVGDGGRLHVKLPESRFCYLLVLSSPEALDYARIEAEILRPGKIYSDPKTYIRKLKLSADRDIASVTGHKALISTVRNLGYRLNGDWTLTFPRAHKDVNRSLSQLQQLARESVRLMAITPLRRNADGLFALDTNVNVDAVADLQQRFQSVVDVLIAATRVMELPIPLGIIEDLYSYFSFHRQGQVEEAVWRQLFEGELWGKMRLLVEAATAPQE